MQTVEYVTSLRAQLWDAGFRPVPVFNADARVTSPGKQPLGENWQIDARKDPPFCATSPAVTHALNTGILADGLRAIDIDIEDQAVAARCRAIAVDRFGEAPIRMRRNSARCLLLYRASEGMPAKVSVAGEHGKVEVLGRGQQFVAFGRHPSGADLEWFPDAPGQERLEAIPAISEQDVLDYLRVVAPIIGAPPPQTQTSDDRTSGDPQADPLRIAAALSAIANSGPADWEAWNRVGMAVWRATGGSSAGWEAWNAWSARNAVYDLTETRARWDHYFTSPPTTIGAGTIFHMARDQGGNDAPEGEPPAGEHDPGWWHSLEQSMLGGVDEALPPPDDEPAVVDEASALDGKIIVPARDWTAPAPLREWIVDGWIPRGYVTGIYGDGGTGKSLLVQQLLTAVACVRPWLGMPVKGGRAFGFMCEDDTKELHRRQEGINHALNLRMGNLELLRLAARFGFDNILMTFDDRNRGTPTELFAQIAKFLTAFHPTLVVLDTLADTFGGNEIVRAHARQFVQGIGGQIARQFNCGVVIAAHPSAAGMATGSGAGGSTAWSNTFRSRLYMTRPDSEKEKDDDVRHLSRMKANYAPKGGEIVVRWQDGAFVLAEGQQKQRLEWREIGVIFDEIERAWNAKDPWSNAPQTKKDGRYLPLWAQVRLGLNERLVASYLEKWLAGGYLKSEIYDPRSKARGLSVIRRLQPVVAAEVDAEVAL